MKRARFLRRRRWLGLAGFPGAVEPPAAVLAPSVGATTPSRRQHKLRRNTLPSDTVTLDNPAAAGKLLLLYVAANGPLTIGVPTGWTAVTGISHTTGTGASQAAFWKVAAGGETSVSWSATAGTATATSALLVEVQDAHATAPVIEGVQSVVNAGTATRASGAASAAATTYANELALAFWAAQAGSSVDATTARGFSNSTDTLIFATATDAAPPLALGSRLLATIGTVPSTEWTWTGDAADENLLGLVRVRPHEAAVAATRWRLLFHDEGAASGYVCIADCEFREVAGAAQTSTGGTASASTTFLDDATYNADKAFDGLGNTRWLSKNVGSEGAFLRYDHAAARAVVQVMVKSANVTGEAAYAPEAFDVQYSSDGTTWTTAWSVTGQTAWGVTETRLFTKP